MVDSPVVASAPASFTSQMATASSNPVANVGSYVNQQLGSLSTGLGSQTGGPPAANLPSQNQSPQSGLLSQTQSLYDSMNNDSARQLQQVQLMNAQKQAQQAQLAQQQRAQQSALAAQQAAQQAGLTSGGAAPAPTAGNAYQPNGALSAARNQALQTATSYLGDRYVLGGTSHNGIDCSGLVMQVYDQFGFGKYLDSHLAGHQAQAIPGVRTSVANLRPGDLVCWNDGSHIAIYAGNGNIIEAANERVGTVERKLWSNNVFGIALRLPGE